MTLDRIASPGGHKLVAGTRTVSPDRIDGSLAVAPDGRLTVHSGKVDLSAEVRTALTQTVAEELDLSVSQVSPIGGEALTRTTA